MKNHILIAEDDPVLREAYERKFKRAGFTLETVKNGEEAVKRLQEKTPDLFICDVMMPGRDGWWVLEQFPREKRRFPVIMLTNLMDDQTRERCQALADGYLTKSTMTLASLIDMMKHILTRKT